MSAVVGAGIDAADVVHRVGMTVAVAMVALCAMATGCGMAVWEEGRRRRALRRRAAAVLGHIPDGDAGRGGGGRGGGGRGGGEGPGGAGWLPGSGWRAGRPRAQARGRPAGTGGPARWAGSLGAAVFVVLLIGGAAGAVAGLVAGFLAYRKLARHQEAQAARSAAEEVHRQLASAADLLAACLAAGAGPREAAEAVGRSLDGPVAERLRRVAAELRLGGEPAVVWRRLAALPGAEELARCMERAGISGVPAVESASRIAADLRAERDRAAAARARRAGVLVTLPLAGCFLPAFLLLGVAPVLIGLADGLLGRN
ncbi:type II secretion system F family protein [Streptomyces sp. NPDC021749]|uniref:type II secretion system F family protein n=1 Tax=Streptomyces sp. NPDC021749 TaxID=3154905 RepID=UPI0033CC24C3